MQTQTLFFRQMRQEDGTWTTFWNTPFVSEAAAYRWLREMHKLAHVGRDGARFVPVEVSVSVPDAK